MLELCTASWREELISTCCQNRRTDVKTKISPYKVTLWDQYMLLGAKSNWSHAWVKDENKCSLMNMVRNKQWTPTWSQCLYPPFWIVLLNTLHCWGNKTRIFQIRLLNKIPRVKRALCFYPSWKTKWPPESTKPDVRTQSHASVEFFFTPSGISFTHTLFLVMLHLMKHLP